MRRGKAWLRRIVALPALTAVAACSVGPAYVRPTVATPGAYKEAVAGWQTAGVAVPPTGRWWDVFGDAELSMLESRIEAGNADLAAAVGRYDQAQGLLRQARADRIPQISVGADASRQRVSAGRPLSLGNPAT